MGRFARFNAWKDGNERRLAHGSAIAFGALALVSLVPWLPNVDAFLFEFHIHSAFAQGARFGSEIVATYGPLGFVGLPIFHPDTFSWLVVLHPLAWLAVLWRLWALGEARELRWGAFTGLWLFAAVIPTGVIMIREWSALLFAPYLLVAAASLSWKPEVEKLDRSDRATAALLGAFTLMKLSFLPLNLVAISVRCMMLKTWRARFEWLGWYVGVITALWLVTGQRLADLPGFVRGAIESIRGYAGSMALWEPIPTSVPLVMVATSGALISWAVIARRQKAWWLLGLVALWGLLFLQVFQNAIVRNDHSHILSGVISIAGLAPVFAAGSTKRLAVTLAATAAAALSLFGVYRAAKLSEPDWNRPLNQARQLPELFRSGTATLRAAYAQQANALGPVIGPFNAKTFETPAVDRPVPDQLGSARLVVHPTVRGYSAFTPWLAAHHRERLEQADGPELVVMCGVPAINDHFPTSVDNGLFVALLTHFTSRGAPGGCGVFQRSTPRALKTTVVLPAVTQPLHALVAVPAHPGAAIWARLQLRRTLGSRVVSLAGKPPIVMLDVVTDDGGVRRYKLNPAMAADGFLLSPVLDSQWAMATFYATREGRRVTAIRIFEQGPAGPVASDFESAYEVELSMLQPEG